MSDDAGGAKAPDADVREGGTPGDATGPAADILIVDDTEDAAPEAGDAFQEEPGSRPLDAARVRQLSAVRRGAYRTRSYFVVAIAACVVAGAQLALMTVRHVRAFGWQPRPLGY